MTAVWAIWAQLSYSNNGLSIVPLALTAVLLVASIALIYKGDEVKAFVAHFVAIASAVVFIWFAVFPDAMKSSIDPAYSLTLAQASATAPTQMIMAGAAVVFVPIVLGYTIWAYKVFAKRIRVEDIPEKSPGLDPKKIRTFETA